MMQAVLCKGGRSAWWGLLCCLAVLGLLAVQFGRSRMPQSLGSVYVNGSIVVTPVQDIPANLSTANARSTWDRDSSGDKSDQPWF